MSAFFGLNIALSSLYAQRRGLEVTGHNIANVNTEGYTRQRVGLQAVGGQVVPAIHATWRGSGAGVGVAGVDRLRDQFVEARALAEHAVDSGLRQTQKVFSRVELSFAEPSADGLQAQLSEFWAGWGDVANNPTDLAARAQVLERAQTLASGFDRARDEVASLWGSSVGQLRVTVDSVNATAARIAELNGAIQRANLGGLSPNDLADQRDALVLELAESVGATVRTGEDGVVDVFVGGTALVRGNRAEQLQVHVPTGTTIDSAPTDPVQVQWAKDGYPATVGGGVAGSLLEAVNETLPDIRAAVDDVAQAVVDRVNARQTAGFDRAGSPGTALFSWDPLEGMGVVISDPARLAASTEAPDPGPPPSPSLDGRNALAVADLAVAKDGPDAAYQAFIVGLGVQAQAVNRRVEIQADITQQIDAVRDAEAGVNLDEELANLVSYQHAYSAAARHLSAVDEMLQTLMGMGR